MTTPTKSDKKPALAGRRSKYVTAADESVEPLEVDPAASDPRRFPPGSPMAFPDPEEPYPTEGEPYPPPTPETPVVAAATPTPRRTTREGD